MVPDYMIKELIDSKCLMDHIRSHRWESIVIVITYSIGINSCMHTEYTSVVSHQYVPSLVRLLVKHYKYTSSSAYVCLQKICESTSIMHTWSLATYHLYLYLINVCYLSPVICICTW